MAEVSRRDAPYDTPEERRAFWNDFVPSAPDPDTVDPLAVARAQREADQAARIAAIKAGPHVFVLTEADYDYFSLDGIYATREGAEKALEELVSGSEGVARERCTIELWAIQP